MKNFQTNYDDSSQLFENASLETQSENHLDQKINLNIAILTISDSRTMDDDKSGNLLYDLVNGSNHHIYERNIVKDDIYEIRKVISSWIYNSDINVIISTGGTGVTGRDGTPEAVEVLFDKKIEGFGEIFRYLSFKKIKNLVA